MSPKCIPAVGYLHLISNFLAVVKDCMSLKAAAAAAAVPAVCY